MLNISAFDLNLLPILEALLEERNVSRAATRVGLSQPAMSNALKRLREVTGDALFIRTGRGMRPTPRAEQLAGPIRAALAQARSALAGEKLFHPKGVQRTFRMAMNDYAEWRLEASMVRRMGKQSKGIMAQVRRVEALFSVPETDLRTGALDLAIGFFPDPRNLDEGTLSETLFEEDNVVVARVGHPGLRKRLTAERFAELDHAAVIYRPEPWGLVDQELARLGLKRRLRLATPHFLTALKAVAESDLIACVPEGLAREFAPGMRLALQRLPIALPAFVTRMLWARHWQQDPGHSWLREQMREAAQEEKGRIHGRA
ncbi:MAG: LysR family transcriptional regulator [Acidobacteriaceae bacterium]|nr:LysR family transcriptional regulator [Acidobacteriaceae bacterium]MBV9307896.1 LysR family transcriptional regulator [Acidobacteriaceae bacterium]